MAAVPVPNVSKALCQLFIELMDLFCNISACSTSDTITQARAKIVLERDAR